MLHHILFCNIGDVYAALSVSDKISFISCVFSAVLLIVTIVSVICAFKAYWHQKNRAKKEAACDLARYYAENIIERNFFVSSVLKLSGLEDEVKRLFPYDRLNNFDMDELKSFLEKQEITYESVDKKFTFIDPQAVLSARIACSTSFQERQDICNEYLIKDKETGDTKIANIEFLQNDFLDKVTNFLNDLEWFSMRCRYGVADEEIIYQSLHTTFLSSVWLLYFYICMRNTKNEDKLFTNVIWLFDRWRRRLRKIQKTASKQQRKAMREMKEAEEQREMAKHKLEKAKPKVFSGKPLK